MLQEGLHCLQERLELGGGGMRARVPAGMNSTASQYVVVLVDVLPDATQRGWSKTAL